VTKSTGLLTKLIGRGEGPTPEEQNGRALQQLLSEKAYRMVYQPLVDLESREIFAYEALVRPQLPTFSSPPVLFDAAVAGGRVGELGRALRQRALEECKGLPLFVNVHPNELDEGWLVRPDEPLFWHDEIIFLEVTESVSLEFFEQWSGVLGEVRAKGVNLAIDDLGAGYSNLKYIADLDPEIVKLDRGLIDGVASSDRQFKLLCNIVRLCEDMGAKVVAEGIETAQELQAVLDAGATYGQGYLLAKPANPAPPIHWPGAVSGRRKMAR